MILWMYDVTSLISEIEMRDFGEKEGECLKKVLKTIHNSAIFILSTIVPIPEDFSFRSCN